MICFIIFCICLQSPAPWTKAGQKMVKKLGLTMQVRVGVLYMEERPGGFGEQRCSY